MIDFRKSLLSEEDLDEIELFDTLSYEELMDYLANRPLNETNQPEIQELDMTYEEFLSTYDVVDLGDFLNSFGVNIK